MNDNDLPADFPDAIEKQRAAIGPEQPARELGAEVPEPDLLDDPETDILDDADFGDGAAPVRVVPLSISDEQLARDLITHFTEIEESGVIHVPATGQTLFAEPHSGLWRRDLDGRLVREIYNYNRNVAELWCNAIPPEVQGSRKIQALMRETRKRFGSTGLMSNVRTAVQAFGGTNYKLLDQNPLLVGVKDGVYDVESGTIRKGKLEEYVTMSTSVAPDPTAECPTFRKFMERIFRHDPELIGFMQRWFGYALTGLTTEQVIVFCYGGGQNGKKPR